MTITWQPEWFTHISIIDHQHLEWLGHLDNLLEAEKLQNKVASSLLLDLFINFGKKHFETEEKYMREAEYPGYERHRAIHFEIMKRLVALRTSDNLTVDLLQVVLDWLSVHMKGEDTEMAAFLRDSNYLNYLQSTKEQ